MKRISYSSIGLAVCLALATWISIPSAAEGAVPQMIALQGKLTDAGGNPVADFQYAVTFKIYPSATYNPNEPVLWMETQMVPTSQGLFSVVLGSTAQGGVPDSVFNDSSRWLGITVGNDPEMTPRLRMTSGAYTYRVNTVEGAKGGNIYGDVHLHSTFLSDIIEIAGKLDIGGRIIGNAANGFLAATGLTAEDRATIGPDNTNIGLHSFIAGEHNTASGPYSTITGGMNNTATGDYTAIGGGLDNSASGNYSSVGGGWQDSASGDLSTIGGGNYNFASAQGTTVGGGLGNRARGRFSVVAGGGGLALADSNSAGSDYSAVGGGRGNIAGGFTALVAGGTFNAAYDSGSVVGGGVNNRARGKYSVISGGGGAASVDSNSASGGWSAIGGGRRNTASGEEAAVGGGLGNSASFTYATVGGGQQNVASGHTATVGGGAGNTASGDRAMIPGGQDNVAAGAYAFAAGRGAHADNSGTFVWADNSSVLPFASTANNQFLIRAAGGVGIGTYLPDVPLHVKNLADDGGVIRVGANTTTTGVEKKICFGDGSFVSIGELSSTDDRMEIRANAGVYINPGGSVGIGTPPGVNALDMASGAYCTYAGVWTNASSRSYKTDIQPLKQSEYAGILEKLEQTDVVRFKYKKDPSREHIGLIAEDVPEEMASEDRTGVPTADAIAFLMAALKAQQAQIKSQQRSIASLEARLNQWR